MELLQSVKQKVGWDSSRFTTVLIVCLVVLPASVLLLMFSGSSSFNRVRGFGPSKIHSNVTASGLGSAAPILPPSQQPATSPTQSPDSTPPPTDPSSPNRPSNRTKQFLNGLLPPGADEPSCLSRYQSYRKHSPHVPSPHLISKLRKYEALHRRCGPRTQFYKRALRNLKSNRVDPHSEGGCKYVLWMPANGLGNRMISMASTFLFALLTDRVLLLNLKSDMDDLFCEPFPNSSWILPGDFPLEKHFWDEKHRFAHSIGARLNNSDSLDVPYLFLNVNHGRYKGDNVFYCGKGQNSIKNIPWLVMLSDQYYAPAFFTMEPFKEEANKMFPEKETVFHHIGRYLFHPSNQAWGLIERFYKAYLEKAEQRIALQIRVFHPNATPFDTVMNQILQCTSKERILPELLDESKLQTLNRTSSSSSSSSKAILAVSLFNEYYEYIKNMYWTKPTVTGDVVGVYQPSHDGYQKFGDNMQNLKAWAEIYLLSTADVLVTSATSTFGYVAQGLGGIKPWILYKTDDKNIPNPACVRDLSMEPCFHFPRNYNCETNEKMDAGGLVPYIKRCKDLNWGVKLVSS